MHAHTRAAHASSHSSKLATGGMAQLMQLKLHCCTGAVLSTLPRRAVQEERTVSKAGGAAGTATLVLKASYPDTRRYLMSYLSPDVHPPLFMFLYHNAAAMSEQQLSRAHSKVGGWGSVFRVCLGAALVWCKVCSS
jgi:hypothetical protein